MSFKRHLSFKATALVFLSPPPASSPKSKFHHFPCTKPDLKEPKQGCGYRDVSPPEVGGRMHSIVLLEKGFPSILSQGRHISSSHFSWPDRVWLSRSFCGNGWKYLYLDLSSAVFVNTRKGQCFSLVRERWCLDLQQHESWKNKRKKEFWQVADPSVSRNH